MNIEQTGALALILTPHGRLLLAPERDAPMLAETVHVRLAGAFTRSTGHGLWHLGAGEVSSALPPTFAWWRDFSARYVSALCATTETDESGCVVGIPAARELDELLTNAPLMTGSEYLTSDVLLSLWDELVAGSLVLYFMLHGSTQNCIDACLVTLPLRF